MPNAAFFPDRSPRIAELEAYIDNWNNESHHFGAETGTEPLEDGSPVTDHVRERNPNVTLVGTTSSFGLTGTQKGASLVQALRRLERLGELVTVVTEWGVYKRMLVVSARARRWGRGVEVTLNLEEKRIVGVTENSLPPGSVSGPAVGNSGEVNRGRVPVSAPGAG